LDPLVVLAFSTLIQFGFWVVAFPDTPTVLNGEPKIYSVTTVAFFLASFFLLLFGVYFGKKLVITHKNSRTSKVCIAGSTPYLYLLAVFSLYISVFFVAAKFIPLIKNPSMFLMIFKPHGISNLHQILLEEREFIAFSTRYLWLLSASIFSVMHFSHDTRNYKSVSFYFWFCIAFVFLYSTIDMARTEFYILLTIVFGSFLLARKPRIQLTKIFLAVILFLFVYWLNSLPRTGIVYADMHNTGLFSLETQAVLYSEFVEKYISGEINNALIIFQYPTDVAKNFASGTLFEQFTPDVFYPERFLNTLHIAGRLYWQFSLVGSFFAAFILGFFIGASYRKALPCIIDGRLSYSTVHYLLVYAGLLNLARLNYYGMAFYLVPLVALGLFYFFISLRSRVDAYR
jgi:hypothetical protein